jgi:hypothetical protein
MAQQVAAIKHHEEIPPNRKRQDWLGENYRVSVGFL